MVVNGVPAALSVLADVCVTSPTCPDLAVPLLELRVERNVGVTCVVEARRELSVGGVLLMSGAAAIATAVGLRMFSTRDR